ncbi:hypothetical protein [Ramlibacter sp. WS9]|uniref:hypothetical protein n=1 Tax=Ramlibacter sp. WS9 TaxID=1882741 RepID=UPI00114445AA|nr:hypothetical protein [Ramlibacter sp. WS9]ROZ76953.1 hypothetical protein EEB15_10190 [Ramlibacter sp. WS9]
MDEPPSIDLLLIACELAGKVECKPQREDGTDAAVYASSGPTVARRIKAGAKFVASFNGAPLEPGLCPARFYWAVSMQVGAVRKTNYKLWLDQSPEEVKNLWRARQEARVLRDSLPHGQRKKKPWGPL